MTTMTDIDLVIPMVFPGDPVWQLEYRKYKGGDDATQHVRFRSWGTEELLVQCCLKYMPWLHRIFLVLASESQEQEWMRILAENREAQVPEVRVVFHREFMPEKYLPCFNVNTIEMHLHRIPGLSEHFIYSNDDFFPLSPLEVSDFFRITDPTPAPPLDGRGVAAHRQGGTLLPCQHHDEKPYPGNPNVFHRFVKNGLDMVAADFGKRFTTTWLRGGHSMQPMLLSTVRKVCELHADRIGQSFTVSRSDRNFNQYIFPFYQHLSGEYIDHVPRRQYVGPGTPASALAGIISDPQAGIVCLNDNEKMEDWEQRAAIVRREIAAKLGMAEERKYGLAKVTDPTPAPPLDGRGVATAEWAGTGDEEAADTRIRETIDVLIIHYNTPELTRAAIRSLWKHTPGARVTVFDNSDRRPLEMKNEELRMKNLLPPSVRIIDNTRGQVIDFDRWLATFPDKQPCPENAYGSARHCYSVEKCYDLFPNGFVLMDSDVLIKQDITPMCDKTKAFVGRIHCNTRNFGFHINRLCPYICWINTPLLRPYGVRYYNAEKMWKLHRWVAGDTSKGCHDTGAWFLEQALRTGLPYSDIEILDYIVHFKAASWRKPNGHIEWLEKHRGLWE